jgi:phage terminase large subunit-like protein
MTRAADNIGWIEENCIVPDARDVGQPVVLREWQREIVRAIYDSPTRRCIISMGRKNGKTGLSACMLLLHLVGPEARPNNQLFSSATTREQAGILFSLAAKMVRANERLRRTVTVRDTYKQLHCPRLGTLYRALSSDAPAAYGLSPAMVVHDELGLVVGPRSELYEALESASGAHERPLSIIISTQAGNAADLLSTLIDDAKAGNDPEVKLVLYTADANIDPFSEEALKQANPAYGDFLTAKSVKAMAEDARRMPARASFFFNRVLNQRVAAVDRFISPIVWDACAGEPDASVFVVGPTYVGVDLSSHLDLTACVAMAKDAAGIWHVRCRCFTPKEGLKQRAIRDRVPYDLWVAQGLLIATEGKTVDYGAVAIFLGELCREMNVAAIAYDPWNFARLEGELKIHNLTSPMREFRQGYKSMSPAITALETELLNGRVRHGADALLSMCFDNAIVTSDPAGNRKLDKSKATGRIDAAVAMTMAIGISLDQEPEPEYRTFVL